MQTTIKARSIRVEKEAPLETLFGNSNIKPRPKIVTKPGMAPDSRKFYVIAKSCPAIRPLVKQFQWDCVQQMAHLVIEEDAQLSAFEWFSTINSRKIETAKSPFGDLEQDALAVCLLDVAGSEVARFKLKGIELTHHNCNLVDRDSPQTLTHYISLKYDKVERLETHREEEDFPFNPDEAVDEEWSQINLAIKED